ncbi:MAG: hypothetical protein M1839_002545 [Geoglossum umbratile]|nr:MAG: hypothetical protein M1839_002545 [Geoglossum umbratile]
MSNVSGTWQWSINKNRNIKSILPKYLTVRTLVELPIHLVYLQRARGARQHWVDPTDEAGFSKNEILDVSSVSGKWLPASSPLPAGPTSCSEYPKLYGGCLPPPPHDYYSTKENGDTGLAPSNYLRLLSPEEFRIPSEYLYLVKAIDKYEASAFGEVGFSKNEILGMSDIVSGGGR